MSGSVSGSIRVHGEFRLSSALARRVQRAVEEIVRESTLPDLSHVDDECALCRGSSGTADEAKEAGRDASQPDRTGHTWVA